MGCKNPSRCDRVMAVCLRCGHIWRSVKHCNWFFVILQHFTPIARSERLFNYYYYVSGSMRHWKKNVFLHVPNCSPHDYAYSEIRVFQPIVNLMASSKANVGDWLPCMEIGSIIWNGKAIQRNTLNKFEILFIILFRFFGRFEVQITNSFRTAIWFTNSAVNKNQLEVVSKK